MFRTVLNWQEFGQVSVHQPIQTISTAFNCAANINLMFIDEKMGTVCFGEADWYRDIALRSILFD